MVLTENNVTFVVQGNISPEWTRNCTFSIRKYYPKSKIIISTWKNQTPFLEFIEYDKVILNKDPGISKNNIARQIVSSLNGIIEADTNYVIKIRSDIQICNNWINYWSAWNQKATDFQRKIIVSNLYSIHPDKQGSLYLCDFIYCGVKEDLIKLFAIPASEDHNGPEEYIATKYLMLKNNYESITDIKKVLRNNFVVFDQNMMKIICLKYPYYKGENMITRKEFEDIYAEL